MNIMAVAHRAGVSTATVSRVINGTAFVSPETAQRVREAIEELNFYPDTNARTLGSGRSSLFGLIISDITNPYFPELVKAFEDIAVEHGKEVLIANTNYDPVRMEHCVVRMLQRKVDGVAVLTSEMDEQLIRNFSRRRIPLVFMDTMAGRPGASSIGSNVSIVRVNYDSGVRAAMAHLLGLGHRDIGFLSGPLTLSSARVRLDAFHAALAEHGLTANPAWVQEGDHRVEGGHHAMQRVLAAAASRPSAVLASNDLTAIGAMGAIHEHGLRIPQDISVMGFDGIELSGYVQPGLTTMLVPRGQVSTLAFRSLLEHHAQGARDDGQHAPRFGPREHGTGPREFVVETSLLERGSTATPKPRPLAGNTAPLAGNTPPPNGNTAPPSGESRNAGSISAVASKPAKRPRTRA